MATATTFEQWARVFTRAGWEPSPESAEPTGPPTHFYLDLPNGSLLVAGPEQAPYREWVCEHYHSREHEQSGRAGSLFHVGSPALTLFFAGKELLSQLGFRYLQECGACGMRGRGECHCGIHCWALPVAEGVLSVLCEPESAAMFTPAGESGFEWCACLYPSWESCENCESMGRDALANPAGSTRWESAHELIRDLVAYLASPAYPSVKRPAPGAPLALPVELL